MMGQNQPTNTVVAAFVFAPALIVCLWLEVTAGTILIRASLQPSPSSHLWAIPVALFAAAGPGMGLVETIRTRFLSLSTAERIVSIEARSLVVAFPLAVLSLLIIAAFASFP